MKCRFCRTPLQDVFADFGAQPPSNAYRRPEELLQPEVTYPLRVYVCDECLLVQVPEFKASQEIFTSSYAYFSGVSRSWTDHCERYAARMIRERGLGAEAQVVELASNDGTLLQFFARQGVPCYGVEPSASVAAAARDRGIESLVDFFGADLAARLVAERGPADLIVANNVLAHVPDLNGFVAGIATLLKPQGLFTGEFPHVQELIARNAFDTIYHEHYSYFSLHTIQRVFERAGLGIADVDVLSTHGGSLRIHAVHGTPPPSDRVREVLQGERRAGLHQRDGYREFQFRCTRVKNAFLRFLLEVREDGRRVAGYGAAAKSNTFLNYCGVRPDLLPYVADLAPSKQGLFLPGSHIPIVAPERLYEDDPDVVFLFPWNIRTEIAAQLRQQGVHGQLVVAVPQLEVLDV